MDQKYNALFTPWKIGNVEIKNRIVMCSMGGTSLFGWMEPCHFDKEAAYFLLETARDDAGQTFAVCGVGLNVGRAPRGLGAICLAALGDAPSFSPLAERLRSGVVSRVNAWAAASGERPLDGIRSDYLARLAWLGEKVRVLAAEGGSELACGTLETVDPWGRAVVAGVPYASELVSLRPTG